MAVNTFLTCVETIDFPVAEYIIIIFMYGRLVSPRGWLLSVLVSILSTNLIVVAHCIVTPHHAMLPSNRQTQTMFSCIYSYRSFVIGTHPDLIHIGYEKVSSVRRSVSRPRRFVLRMRAILLLCQSVGHFSEVLK